ncbi:MAG TPA: SDR family NAD(P)-dependent oxidoreductase [Mycobacteriales bacterium]|jgi:NAD(P)-dependent dehydrogenase (short-subunit alcohol dehydrogenase family)|nr:SDR family NAD(P)-dependent oxidoreductase [Mycobacteriales bacterium]
MTAPRTTAPDFSGKVAWVTGGAQGFGAGVATRLASLGAQVVVSDINQDSGEAVAAEIGGAFVACDVSRLEDCQAAVAAVIERHGRLDIAFLNAGIATGCTVGEDFDLALYRRAMGVNLDGVVFGAHAAFAALKATSGDVVATASLAGLVGTGFDPIYGANKHGVVGLVRAIGEDWVQHGIRVNALCPGFADTAIVDPLRELLSDSGIPLIPVELVVDAFVSAATSGRSGECWYIQPGRPAEPFRFRGIPGPRTE